MQKLNKLKILTINIDYTLAMDSPNFGDAQQRNIDYGKHVNKIFSITHSPKKMGLKNKKLSEKVEIFPTSSLHPLFFIFNALKIAKTIFKKNKIDLVLTQDPFITGLVGYLIKKKYKCSYLIHFHGDFWQNKYWLKDKWYNFILLYISKFLVKRADGVRVVSFGIKDKLVKFGINKKKIRVIPTPVNFDNFENYDYDKVNKIKNRYPNKIILNIGRDDPAKDYKTLDKTIKLVRDKYRNIHLVQSKIIGEIKQKELTNYYHASDVYVSSSRHESLGKVLIEAMACGLPVVATSTTGSKEIIIDKENGFLVPVKDSEALAKKVIYLLNNTDIAKKMGEKGQIIVKEKFNRKIIIEKIINFWKDLCVS